MKKIFAYSMFMLLAAQGAATAADLFRVDVTVGGTTQSKAFDNVSDVADVNYGDINGTYTTNTATSVNLFMRGVNMTSSYALNSPTMVFDVPSMGIHQVFAGATRDESQDMFIDWLKGNNSRLLKGLVAESPIDPIAGNPNSLMSRMGASDFQMATGLASSSAPGLQTSNENGPVVVGLEAEYGQFKSSDFNGSSYQLPISMTVPLTSGGMELLFSLPIQYTEVEGAASYATGLGVGLRVPVTKYWSLTPALRAGAAGSVDLGAGAALYSGSLTSTLGDTFGGYDVKMGNLVAYYQSQPINIGDVSLDYGLSNEAFINGISVSHALPLSIFGITPRAQLFVTNTQFTGSELFISNYTDVGAALNLPVTVLGKTYDQATLGATYSFGDNYSAVRANFGFKF